MPIFGNKANTFQPGVIGPYNAYGYKYSGSCNSPASFNCENQSLSSNCASSCCDATVPIDQGTRQTVGYDWYRVLEKHGECKIIDSKWYVEECAREPLEFQDAKIEGLVTSIKVKGDRLGSEYKIVNRITTEENTTHQKVFCIKIIGCVNARMTYVKTTGCCPKMNGIVKSEPVPNEVVCENEGMELQHVLPEGLYNLHDLTKRPVNRVSFYLMSGSSRVYLDGPHEITKEGLTISNEGCPVENFVLMIDCDSMVNYTIEEM